MARPLSGVFRHLRPRHILTHVQSGRCWYHNLMSLKKTTVMVDEADLAVIKKAAARDGRPESEYFREAFHLAALRAQRWDDQWEIPRFDFGHAISADEVHKTVSDAVADAS